MITTIIINSGNITHTASPSEHYSPRNPGPYPIIIEYTLFGANIGNSHPLALARIINLLSSIFINISLRGKNRISVSSPSYANGNYFLQNHNFFLKHNLKSFIPSTSLYKLGVIYAHPSFSEDNIREGFESSTLCNLH